MTKRKVGGYEFNYQINRAMNECSNIREHLRKIVEQKVGPQTQALLLTKSALGIGEVEEILRNLAEIGADIKERRTQ
jgi:hypothetical protein